MALPASNVRRAIYEIMLKTSHGKTTCTVPTRRRSTRVMFNKGRGRGPHCFSYVWVLRIVGVCIPMPCPQRRRIPSIIRAVSPCFTPSCIARCRERSRPPMPPFDPRAASTLSLTRPPISPHLAQISPFLYDVLSPWRFGGQCRPTITRPYLLYYIYVVACGLKGLYGVSTLSRVPLLFFFFTSSASFVYIFRLQLFCCESRRLYYVTNSCHYL